MRKTSNEIKRHAVTFRAKYAKSPSVYRFIISRGYIDSNVYVWKINWNAFPGAFFERYFFVSETSGRRLLDSA